VAERIVQANGVPLCVETFGDRADPAVLLVMGSSASMDWWEDEFCERLAAGGRFVVRYDLRDTGRSISYEPGAPQYGLDDLGEDAAGLLDALDLPVAHVVGISMGSGIAQYLALEHPDRVASLTLIASSPGQEGLPSMSEETAAAFGVDPPDWSDRDAVIEYGTHLARVSAARSEPFDEAGMRELWGRVVDRTDNIASTMTNHNVMDFGESRRDRLGEISVPTLVVHGTEDPVLPHAHGVALANEIPGARLLTLEGTGHELPRRTWDVVVPAILEIPRG
jgi:pimeloyl-ACP methyl ester carboxylesterase